MVLPFSVVAMPFLIMTSQRPCDCNCFWRLYNDLFEFLGFWQLEKLSDLQCTPETQLKFIVDAWMQVNICAHYAMYTKLIVFLLSKNHITKYQEDVEVYQMWHLSEDNPS